MGEIKSTLDIIMEKAKKFSLTEEEKKGFKRQELEGKIKGLVQKALDGVLDSERFQLEVVALRTKEKELVDSLQQEHINQSKESLLLNFASELSEVVLKNSDQINEGQLVDGLLSVCSTKEKDNSELQKLIMKKRQLLVKFYKIH